MQFHFEFNGWDGNSPVSRHGVGDTPVGRHDEALGTPCDHAFYDIVCRFPPPRKNDGNPTLPFNFDLPTGLAPPSEMEGDYFLIIYYFSLKHQKLYSCVRSWLYS